MSFTLERVVGQTLIFTLTFGLTLFFACLDSFGLSTPSASRSNRFRFFLGNVFLSLAVGLGEITDRTSFGKNVWLILGLFLLGALCILPIRRELRRTLGR